MLKSLVLCLFLASFVFANDPVRVKLTKHKKPVTKGTLRFGKPVNETLVDHIFLYTGEIHVGTPPRKFVVDFDTASPTLWLTSKDCKYVEGSAVCFNQKNKYYPDESSTSKDLHQKMGMDYYESYVRGGWFSDKVGLTPDASATTTNETFKFGLADTLKGFTQSDYDGLFGLSFREEPKDRQTFIEYLRDNNIFDPPIFTVWLERNVSDEVLGGNIIFGAKDEDHCEEDIVTVKAAIKKPSWTFELDSVILDGKEIDGKAMAVADSGSSLLGVSQKIFDKLSEKYPVPQWQPPEEASMFPCGEHEDIKLEFVVGGKKLLLGAKDLIFSYRQIPEKCFFGISTFKYDGIDYLLSDAFMRSFCLTHDYKNETLTFARAKHSN